jgi:integrase
MAGRRPLNQTEERRLLGVIRKLSPRDRALVTTQWFTGFRISEVLKLTVGAVWRDGQIVTKLGLPPRSLKGGYGRTRWVPVVPELERALSSLIGHLRRRLELTPDVPLFLSRQCDRECNLRAIARGPARTVIHRAFALAGIENDGRLGTHTLRKTIARKVIAHNGHNIMILKAALGHADVSTIQKYLEVEEDAVMAAITKGDFTRRPRRSAPKPLTLVSRNPFGGGFPANEDVELSLRRVRLCRNLLRCGLVEIYAKILTKAASCADSS